METITSGIIKLLPLKASQAMSGLADLRNTMRHFLLLKYLQVLALPSENRLMLALGALASLYIAATLLNSPQASRKASSVLLGQLASADLLLLLRWCLKVVLEFLEVPEEATKGLEHDILASHHLAGLLLLTFVSLEALLVCRRPAETRGLRTARCARLASTATWVGVALEFLILQGAKHADVLKGQGGWLTLLGLGCAIMAPIAQFVSHCARLLLWPMNTYICYTVFYNKPQRGRSCFH